ncbi:TPA: hypothetical protein ACIZ0G_001454 [Streptococcus agalactiae]
MLIKGLLSPNSKVSPKDYKVYMRVLSFVFSVCSLIMIVSSFLHTFESNFTKGFSFGSGIALFAGSFYFLVITFSEKRFQHYYTKVFDERNQFIANMSCRLLFLLSILVLVVLCLINVWFGITFSYAKFLLLILSFILYGYLLIYFILQKLL